MNWTLARSLAAAVVVVLGAGVGAIVGRAFGAPIAGAMVCAALASAALAAWDTARGQALLDWLRGPQTGPAPREAGWWGELAYRVERGLRARDNAIGEEKHRLREFLQAIEA